MRPLLVVAVVVAVAAVASAQCPAGALLQLPMALDVDQAGVEFPVATAAGGLTDLTVKLSFTFFPINLCMDTICPVALTAGIFLGSDCVDVDPVTNAGDFEPALVASPIDLPALNSPAAIPVLFNDDGSADGSLLVNGNELALNLPVGTHCLLFGLEHVVGECVQLTLQQPGTLSLCASAALCAGDAELAAAHCCFTLVCRAAPRNRARQHHSSCAKLPRKGVQRRQHPVHAGVHVLLHRRPVL